MSHLRTQISFVQSFDTLNLYILCKDLRGRFWKNISLEGFQEGHEDTCDDSCHNNVYDIVPYIVGGIWRTSYRKTCTQASYRSLTTFCFAPLFFVSYSSNLTFFTLSVRWIFFQLDLPVDIYFSWRQLHTYCKDLTFFTPWGCDFSFITILSAWIWKKTSCFKLQSLGALEA